MKKLVLKIKIKAVVELITGLHIGGNSDNIEIGGIDLPVVKTAFRCGKPDNQPYIPGSSLKGKMRCLLEQLNGATEVGGCEKVNNLFGFSKDNKSSKDNKPSKLIVRDAYLTQDSVDLFANNDTLDMPYTESKYENVIDRVKGIAEHPRQIERVPAGARFNVEFIINVWDDDNKAELLELFEEGIKALENDYLGGNGSRGYGQIKFSEREVEEVSFNN